MLNRECRFIFFLVILGLVVTVLPSVAENLLGNGNFEERMGQGFTRWTGSDGMASPSALQGQWCLELRNPKAVWQGVRQDVTLDGSRVTEITVRAFGLARDVVGGPQEWNVPRIMVLFFARDGSQLGGWPELGRWESSSNWSCREKIFAVPPATRRVRIAIELPECRGSFLVDDLSLVAGRPERPFDPGNLLYNGGLEYGAEVPGEWDWGGDAEFALQSPGRNSLLCFFLEVKKANWAMLRQTIDLDGKVVRKITVSADYRLEGVTRGKESWEQARLHLEFLDVEGKRLTGWPVVGSGTGTSRGWQTWQQELDVPPETSRLVVAAGMANAAGKLWLDNLLVCGFDKKGKGIVKQDTRSRDTSAWFAFKPGFSDYIPPAVDLSFLLDKPAGKHGCIQRRGDKLFFQDETPVRFWGTNLVGSNIFVPAAEAVKLADRLAALGVNLIRLHHMDAPWSTPNIFDNDPATTRRLSPKRLAQLDYLIACLKERGIYIYLDLLVHRSAAPGDEVRDGEALENGWKGAAHFDPKLRALQEEYARQLFTHKNPHLDEIYATEPAIVFSEVINESSLFYIDRMTPMPASYLQLLDQLFNQWLKARYRTHSGLVKAWKKAGTLDLAAGENLTKGNIRRARLDIDWNRWLDNVLAPGSPGRSMDTKRFYAALQTDHFNGMRDYLRKLGYRALITGSNHWEVHGGDIFSNAHLDFLDRHSYFDHPDTSRGWGLQEISLHNTDILRTLENSVTELAHTRVVERPFVVSEWNIPFPNEYRLAGPLLMAAYGRFQDWGGVLQFAFNSSAWSKALDESFDISQSPAILSQWVPAALLFHKGYVQPAEHLVVERVGEEQIFLDPTSSFRITGNTPELPLISRVATEYSTLETAGDSDVFSLVERYHDAARGIVSSDTGELQWDYHRGIFMVDTPWVQGAVGSLGGEVLPLGEVTIEAYTPYCSVFVSSLDGLPLKTSRRVLVTAAAGEQNSGFEFNHSHTGINRAGNPPILLENVEALLSLRLPGVLEVTSLGASRHEDNKSLAAEGGDLRISGRYQALHYLITRK